MATVLPPPPKRQKLEAAEKARVQQEPTPIPEGSIRVQFVDRTTNTPAGPAVSIPLTQATVKNLEVLLNSLLGVNDARDRIPYRFFHERRRKTADKEEQDEEEALADGADIYTSLVQKGLASTEEELSLSYAPQAVFRVKAVTRCASSISGHGEPILCAQFSPSSSSRLCTGSGDNTARIWDCDTGTPLFTLKGHTSWVLCVAYSPDDTMIATGSNDKTVRLWDPKTGKPLGNAMKGHTAFVRSLAWEPYHLQEPGRPRVASSSKDSTVRIWDAVSKHADIVLTGHKGSVSCVKWGGTGWIYTSSQDKTIKIWASSNGQLVHTLAAHAHWVNHLALSTDAVLRTGFFSGGGSAAGSAAERQAAAQARFRAAATTGGAVAERLCSASDDAVLLLWAPQGGAPAKPVARLLGHQRQVNHVAFSPDGLWIASAGFDGAVKLWAARDGAFVRSFRAHVAPVYMVAWSPDSRLLVSASKDTTLKCWDVRTGKIAADLPGHLDEVYAVDWSPDGERVGSGGRDKAVRLWRH